MLIDWNFYNEFNAV